MNFKNIAPYIGRLYILFCVLVTTLISVLVIYQSYSSKIFRDSPLLQFGIPILTIIGLYGLILPTQKPQKLGIKPDTLTQGYLDNTVNTKLQYRIAPNNKIEVYEIPKLIIWRQKIVYIGITLLTADRDILAKHILDSINTSSVNTLKRELSFWQGIASVTSNNFQFWKTFTTWYIRCLSKFVDNNYPPESNIFNYYIVDKIKKKEFNIFEEYIKQNSNDKFAIIAAKQLDEYCRKMWIAAHAIITNTELTLNEAELPGYQDVSQLASLGLIGLPPEKIIDGLNERLNYDTNNTCSVQINDTQYDKIISTINKNCPHVHVNHIVKKNIQILPEIPSFIVTCTQHKSLFDINERTKLIEKQLQSIVNNLNGDWTIVVVNKSKL